MSLAEFFTLTKESSFNILNMYEKAPDETLISLGIIALILLVAFFFINRTIKIKNAIKVIKNIKNSKTYDEYLDKLAFLVEEVPKRGEEVVSVLNNEKEQLWFRTSKLLTSMTICKKIESYLTLSKNFELLAKGAKKYNNTEAVNFFQEKSKEFLDENLAFEIKNYYENRNFDINELENINAIVKYANTLQNPDVIINPLKKEIDRFSFGYNSDLYKLIEKLDEKESKQIYYYCKEKIEKLFESGDDEISINILDYLLESNQKQKVYDYISSLHLKEYLQQLYNLYFNKKEDINLDLAFIANPLKIESEYKNYLDESLTTNWRDEEHIRFIAKSKGVIEVLGHMEFRTLLERAENIAISKENRKKIDEALTIAKRAESIALEAKSLNKRPISSIQKSENN